MQEGILKIGRQYPSHPVLYVRRSCIFCCRHITSVVEPSWFVPVPVTVPVPTIEKFWFWFQLRFQFQFRIQTIFSIVSKNEKWHKILPVPCQKQLISQKIYFSFWFFYFFITFYVGSVSKSGSGTGSGTRAETVLYSGSGSAKAKSYGSSGSGSGSGSTTMHITAAGSTTQPQCHLFLKTVCHLRD